jgi:hypothetical protein
MFKLKKVISNIKNGINLRNYCSINKVENEKNFDLQFFNFYNFYWECQHIHFSYTLN